jgi:hypothetical protein
VLLAPSHRDKGSRRRLRKAATSFAFGRVAATGEHKVLWIFHRLKDDDRPHLFEVLTLGLGGRCHGRARPSNNQGFKSPAIATVIARYSCLRKIKLFVSMYNLAAIARYILI